MKPFRVDRLAYFEDLEKDPDSQKAIEEIGLQESANEWIPAIVDGEWNPVIDNKDHTLHSASYFEVRNPDFVLYEGSYGNFNPKNDEVADLYYNKKFNSVLFFIRDSVRGLISDPQNVVKIKAWAIRFLLKKGAQHRTPMSEVLA